MVHLPKTHTDFVDIGELPDEYRRDAAVYACRHATSTHDARLLLEALGLNDLEPDSE